MEGEVQTRWVPTAASTFETRELHVSNQGAITDMSPLTEVSDLEAVLASAQTWDFVNTDYIYLMGCSQGGLVSALTAPDHADEIRAAILFL